MKTFNAIITMVVLLVLVSAVAMAEENLLGSSVFSKSDKWTVFIAKDARKTGSKYDFSDGLLTVTSTATAKQNPSSIQIMKNVELSANKKYKITLKIKSDKPGILAVVYGLRGAPYSGYAASKIKFTAGDKEYSCTLSLNKKANESKAPKCLRLVAGGLKDTTLMLSNISVKKISHKQD